MNVSAPLIKASKQYADRLCVSCNKFNEPKYFFTRRVNYSYKFSEGFYENESKIFLDNPDDYLASKFIEESVVEDVFKKHVSLKYVAIISVKVFAHWFFRLLSKVTRTKQSFTCFRKCYVDDIEQVFEQDKIGVLRAVFPFPLSLARQFRYFLYLKKKKYSYAFYGAPYTFSSYVSFVFFRSVKSLMLMELLASYRLAKELKLEGFTEVEISDEYDVSSLDFSRFARRFSIYVINSAHGIGSFMPFHAYSKFYYLSDKQRDYYRTNFNCLYLKRTLNSKSNQHHYDNKSYANDMVFNLVFLSQASKFAPDYVYKEEQKVLGKLKSTYENSKNILLNYKPHPNNSNTLALDSFKIIYDITPLNGLGSTIYVSLYSTSHIDPTFVGRKFLIQSGAIRPQIIFDDIENIVTVEELIDYIGHL